MKVIVIGTNHAGTTAVRTLKRIAPDTEVITYDKGDKISFLGCGIALWVSGEVKNPQELFYASPDLLKSEGIKVSMNHEWVGFNPDKHEIQVKDLKTGAIKTDWYDKLIVATGSWPLLPPIPGIKLEKIQICKNYHHGQIIAKENLDPKVKNVIIVGAGYIGAELVDAFVKKGKKVTLIDVAPRVMVNYYDEEFTKPIEDRMKQNGVDLRLNEKVIAFKGDNGICNKVVTDKDEIPSDFTIFSVGVVPQTGLLKEHVELTPTGAIKTNAFSQSSNPDIYAIGDCATVYDIATNRDQPIQLATTAVRTGIMAAINIIKGNALTTPGFTGANGIDVFDYKMASTGMTESSAKKFGFDVETVLLKDNDRPEFMATQKEVQIKLVWDKKSRRLLGAQVASEANHTETIYALALAIQQKLTIDDVPLIDIFFLPHFNKPYNFVTLAGLEALGLNFFESKIKAKADDVEIGTQQDESTNFPNL